MIAQVEQRLRAWSHEVEHDENARLASYLVRARRRIVRRSQSLFELSVVYLLCSVTLTFFAHRSEFVILAGGPIYIAFGYMIWTVLENAVDASEGSGFRVLANPARWRRNGLAFGRGLGALILTSIFAFLWMTFVILVVLIVGRGHVHFQVVEFAQIQIPLIRPVWMVLPLLLAVLAPIVAVHRKLLRRAKKTITRSHPKHVGDRIAWGLLILLGLIFYLDMRSVFMHLPFPIGQLCSSTLALLLTIVTAAFELTFLEEHTKVAQEI